MRNKPIKPRKRSRRQKLRDEPSFTKRRKGGALFAHIFALCRKYECNFKTAAKILQYGPVRVFGQGKPIPLTKKKKTKELSSKAGQVNEIPGVTS